MNFERKQGPVSCEFISVLGVRFLRGGYEDALSLLKNGAFMIAPSAPSLVMLDEDIAYREAMCSADFAIPDSGLMVLLCRLLGLGKFHKLSGPRFLNRFLSDAEVAGKHLLVVDPNLEESNLNRDFLRQLPNKFCTTHYVAPLYPPGEIVDSLLLAKVENVNPDYVLINLGGGVQERVAYFLKRNSSRGQGILCTGAAIAFFTGAQVKVPRVFDELYLGWLVRCVSNPNKYLRRYALALQLVPMMIRGTKGGQKS
mgnify:FL=1